MFNRKAFLILFLFVLIVGTVSAVSASDLTNEDMGNSDSDKIEISENDDVIDMKTNDEIIGASDADDGLDVLKDDDQWATFTSLQNIIDNAQEGVKLTLFSNYYCDDDFKGEGITIMKPITIDAQGHSWDACRKSSVLLIFSDGVVINNLNLINGYDDDDAGAGAYIRSSSTTFNYCNFINNTAGTNGGAIDVTGTLHLNGCIFYNNIAKGDGGAINAHHPVYGNLSLDIYDSIFDYNWAKGNGGAIYLDCFNADGSFVDGSAGTFISKCLFKSNEAGHSDALGSSEAGYGGAIFNFQYADIEGTDFKDNYATNGGGAIYMNNGVTDNEGTVTQIFGLNIHGTSNFINNYAGRYGGAIKIYANPTPLAKGIKGVLNIYDDVLFEENEAKTGGALSIIDSKSNVEGAYFKNNYAQTGGAVEGGKLVNCLFEGNSEPITSETLVVCDVKPKITITQSGTYYPDKKLTITLKDSVSGRVMLNQKLNIAFSNGKTATVTTNSNGVATYAVPFTGTVIATISYSGTGIKYSESQKVVIKKVTPKINAAKKTYKVKLKTKSYTVTLKANNKVLKSKKVTLKVNGKTYSAKTNSKGQATFKINKLTKKGSFNAVIKFAGDSLYNKATKTVKIITK
ncbi:hypothetical protein [Methanobrevibacter sp.]|uniref:hypothetical protein n=1 Tax=Methanobrevibacter sp. TaxID=66852 RepID=UPI00386C1AEE